MRDRLERLRSARLYLVCDAQPDDFLHRVLVAGVDIVQLRMKHVADEQILAAGRRFASACAEHEALFIINDRPDLAAELDADGVHLGQDDVPVPEARAAVGADRLVGLSTHSPAQVDRAPAAGADYIGVGPVYPTPTKPGRPAVGLDLVRYAAARARLPFFAIGGVTAGNVRAVRAAGATRVAVVRALTESPQPELTAREIREALAGVEVPVGSA